MKSQSLRWRFVNQGNPTETVLVHDQGSAQTLAMLLQKTGGDWIMQEERPLGGMTPQAPAQAQPAASVQASVPAPVQVQAPVHAPIAAPAPASVAAPVAQAPVQPSHPPQVQAAAPVQVPIPAPMPVVAQAVAPVAPPPVQQSAAFAPPPPIELEEAHREEESAEDHSMAHAMIEAVVNAAQQEIRAEERKAVMPPPAPKKQEKRERRSAQRFMTEFRVILISGSSSFRTMSADVSLGGMRLKKTIPASFMKEKCIAYVSHKDLRENIEIVCHVVGDPSDPCRIQFIQPNSTQLKRLNDWLIEHNQGGLPRGTKAS